MSLSGTRGVYRQFMANDLTMLIRAFAGLGDAAGAAEVERELARLWDSDPAMKTLDARLAGVIEGDQQPKDGPD